MEPKLRVFSLEDYVSVLKPEFGTPDHFDGYFELRVGVIIVFFSVHGRRPTSFSGGTLFHSSRSQPLGEIEFSLN